MHHCCYTKLQNSCLPADQMLKRSNLGHFLIKRPNKVTYLLETRVLGLFALDELINVDILLQRTRKHEFLNVSQRWGVEFGITPRYGLRHLLRMTQNDWKSHSRTTRKSFTELLQGFHSFHGNTAGMYVINLVCGPSPMAVRSRASWEQAKGSFCVCGGF